LCFAEAKHKTLLPLAKEIVCQGQGAVVCRFIGAFKDAHKWASYRYVSSAATKAMQQMGFFQRKLNIEGGFEQQCLKSAVWKSLTAHR